MCLALAIALGLAASTATGAAAEPPIPQAKNILVIVLDDVGTDQLSFYGETPPWIPPVLCPTVAPTGYVEPYANTPRLDKLRQSGILFNNAYANPVCSPTRSCILTGRYAFRTGVGQITNEGQFELDDQEVVIPKLLRDGFNPNAAILGLPYKCGAFGKWHLTYLSGDGTHPTRTGFHHFAGSISNVAALNENYFNWTKIVHDAGTPPPIPGPNTAWYGIETATDAKNWINAQNKAFFAYVCFNPPHDPFQVPPQALVSPATWNEIQCWCPFVWPGCPGGPEQKIADGSTPLRMRRLVYRALIEAVDSQIGWLLDNITPAKLANTTIFVIGDNGTPGNIVNVPPHTAGHGKATVYEWGVRVPLIVSGPLVPAPGGFVSDAPIGAVDLWDTIADITGANPDIAAPGVAIDSVSFLPVILDPVHHPGTRQYAFSQYFEPNGIPDPPPNQNLCFERHNRSISDGSYKYIRLQDVKPPNDCNAPNYTHKFFRIGENHEETIDLIANGGWTPGAWATYQAMTAEMDAVSQP